MDYQFRDLENKWQQFWAENQTFKVENTSSKPKYYVLDMFPYPSGAGLHVGHPLGYIASDIFARYKRLKGFNVLHPMGYDSFGLPAEQYAIQTGQHPAITTETNINRYREQLDNIGFSFDWSREVRTSDPAYYKWSQWIFMQLFNSWYNVASDKAEPIEKLASHFAAQGTQGIKAVADDDVAVFTAEEWLRKTNEEQQVELLKYRLTYLRESTVNWCSALGTVLANDEVKDGVSERGGYAVEQKKMMQWSMRITAYADRLLNGLNTIDWPEPLKEMQRNWIGKSVGALIKFSLIPNPSPKEKGAFGYQTGDSGIWEILKANARENRREQTDAESVLWQHLRNNQTGFKIRRQHAIGSYIADFVCLSKGLIIEVDGGYYQENSTQDNLRTEALNQLGFDVIRFFNEQVIGDTELIVNEIKEKLKESADRLVESSSSLSFGEGRGEAIEVFTTRVDTIFGVSFLVIAPEHELVKELTTDEQLQDIQNYIAITKKKSELDRMADTKTVSGAFTGSYAINPLNGAKIPVWIADYVLAGYGTGAVMAVPSGDQRDYLFAKHFNLPIIQILDSQLIETEADATKEGKYVNSDLINGLTYQEAVPAVIAKLEELGAGKAKVNYRIRDAIFGRQRYWGEPVPVYFKDNLPHLIEESDLPLVLPEVDKYLPTESGEPPLGRAEGWNYKAPPKSSPGGRTFIEQSENRGIYRQQSDPGNYENLRDNARQHRKEPTQAESVLWEFLRGSKTGYKFRRQHPLDNFIADFACLQKGLIVEVDGLYHNDNIENDQLRTEVLSNYGFEVIRFSNAEVLSSPDVVTKAIINRLATLSDRPSHSDLLGKVSPSGGDLEGAEYPYELSTMPGWAGSSWYWFRYMDAQNDNAFADKKAIEYWKDVDLYIGGSEHATGHLLYSRFWNKALKDLGYVTEEEPFKKLINQGMIQGRSSFVYRLIDEEGKGTNTFVSYGLKEDYKTTALHVDVNIVDNDILDLNEFKASRDEYTEAQFILENGKYHCGHEVEKMSKRYYNVVNPDDIVERYGADTLRLYEMFLGPLEQSKPWNTNGIEGVFKFLRKFWKLFHDDQFNFVVSDEEPAKAEYKALHKIIRKVEDDIERFSFNTSVSSFMICVNELTDLKCNKRSILQDLVKVLNPYAPHITEELWSLLGNQAGSITYADFPVFNADYLVENEFAYPVSINGKMKMNLNISLSLENKEVEQLVLDNSDVQRYLDGKAVKKLIYVKGKIVNLVV